MEFKETSNNTNKKQSTSDKSTAITKAQTTKITHKGGQFKTSGDTLAINHIIPPGMQGMIGEIGQALGFNISDPMSLTKEQVINAKKLAAQLDEKLLCMKELYPCIIKFLSFQINAAEFQAEIVVNAAKAKYKIDEAQAKAFVVYQRYLRKAANLEKRIQQQQQIIDASYSYFESVQDARSNAILAGLNQQARLGVQNTEAAASLKQQRQQVLAERRARLQEMKHDLKTQHLTAGN